MSHTHCGVFKQNLGGTPWPVWIEQNVDSDRRSGSGYIDAVRAGGNKCLLKIEDAVLILKDLQDFHGSGSTSLGFTSGEVGLVTHVKDAFECVGCNKVHEFMTKKDGAIPLFFTSSMSGTRVVQQCAR